MKHLLSILLISTLFAGELEVNGDLTVTGNIQNQTIDSLLQVIQSLETEVNFLSNSLNSSVKYLGSGSEVTLNPASINKYILVAGRTNSDPAYLLLNGSYQNGWTNITNTDHFFFHSIDTSNESNEFYEYVNGNESFTIGGYSCGCNNLNNLPENPNVGFLVFTYDDMNLEMESNLQLRKSGLQSKDKETVK